ncbi:hypothetical protein [Streptomyces sp. NPDC048489]|uniref:hypothetical protein n=1 Tax=Streptomyces sp. NPDC048489 TaxID=3154504 RepID=UPI00342AE119
MACDSGNSAGDAIKGFFDFLGDPIGTILEVIANRILDGAISLFGDMVTDVPTLIVDPSRDVNGKTQWIVVYTAVGSLIFAAARMAIERRGEAGATALKGMLRVLFVAGGATAVAVPLASLSDNYSATLFTDSAKQEVINVGCSGGGGIQAVLLIVLAFMLLIAAIVQTVLLYVRLGVMIILFGTLPLAATASMTNWGSGWWRKHIGWMIAWLLYKPAAGLVIYAGAAMIHSDPKDQNAAHTKIAGIGVLLLSAVALPALLKLVIPATAALGTAGGKGSTSAMTGALASGARSIGGAMNSGMSGGGGPQGLPGKGPSGASSGGAPGGGGAAAAAGPAGAAVSAAVTVAKAVGNIASSAVDGADGERGHNR